MRILVISDISWRSADDFFVWRAKRSSAVLERLKKQVEEIHPDLVLLAGDLVNDIGFIGFKEYWKDVRVFFEFLDQCKIQTFFIRGNWDECSEYDKLIKLTEKKLTYVKEISEKIENFQGLKILGLSYSFTNEMKEIRYLSNELHEPIDLVLAHTEYKRRVWLFHLNAKLIVTGHFDKQLCQIRDKVFISLQSFPDQYTVIDYKPASYKIRYVDSAMGKVVIRKASFSTGYLAWNENPFKNSRLYAVQMEELMSAKKIFYSDRTRRKEITNKLLDSGIGKKQIEEYLQINLR